MQAVAAELSGYAGNSAAFWRGEFKSLKTGCFEIANFKHALKQTRSVCLRAFLARNELVASAFA
jgi:hypothetical protein